MTGVLPIYGSESKWVAESLYQSEWWISLLPNVPHVLPALVAYVPFTCMGKPVGPRFGQNGKQNSGLVKLILSRNRVYHLYKSVSFSEKRPLRREAGVKDDFEKMEHEFPFETFRPEKQDYLIRYSVALGNLPLKRPDPKSRVPFNQPDFPETFCKW